MKKETIRDCFNLLEADYGKQTNQKRELWGKMFKKCSDEQLIRAVGEYIDKGKFFPRISDIKEMIEGTLEDEVELAWGYLVEVIMREGYYNSVSFPKYPAVGATVEQMAGGWCEFNDLFDNDKEKWIKKDFLRIYPIMKRRGIFPNRLIGQFELDNLNKGYTKETIRRHGLTIDGRRIDRKQIDGDKKLQIEGKNEPKPNKYDKYLRKE